jgi:hypothetical protein
LGLITSFPITSGKRNPCLAKFLLYWWVLQYFTYCCGVSNVYKLSHGQHVCGRKYSNWIQLFELSLEFALLAFGYNKYSIENNTGKNNCHH